MPCRSGRPSDARGTAFPVVGFAAGAGLGGDCAATEITAIVARPQASGTTRMADSSLLADYVFSSQSRTRLTITSTAFSMSCTETHSSRE